MPLLKRFLKNLPEKLSYIKNNSLNNSDFASVNIYFEDESRLGLLTILRRVLTTKGIKPIAPYQHKFDNLYLFGAFSPINGDNFLLEMPVCNSEAFQIFLDEFSSQKPDEFKIMFLDNGAFHHAKRLNIPSNISLLFLPPYSPELNPAEKIWRFIKDHLSMTIHKDLPALQNHLSQILQDHLTYETVKSVCGNEFYKTSFKCIFNV
jgi:DDE superfamily endonuclease